MAFFKRIARVGGGERGPLVKRGRGRRDRGGAAALYLENFKARGKLLFIARIAFLFVLGEEICGASATGPRVVGRCGGRQRIIGKIKGKVGEERQGTESRFWKEGEGQREGNNGKAHRGRGGEGTTGGEGWEAGKALGGTGLPAPQLKKRIFMRRQYVDGGEHMHVQQNRHHPHPIQ
jgi:hypothetical protein